MCGLAGIFLGDSERSPIELAALRSVFTRLLVLSELRGRHATGVALVDRNSRHWLAKRAVPASAFVADPVYQKILSRLGNDSAVLLGHARWATRGSVEDDRNNQPIRAGQVIGTHNGTIENADELFERLALRRTAEVDSEVLFRAAAETLRSGALDEAEILAFLALCHGQVAAALISREEPGRLLLIRGNRPLQVRYHARLRTAIWASEALFLDAVLGGDVGWRELALPAMHRLELRTEGDPSRAKPRPFQLATPLEPAALAPVASSRLASPVRTKHPPRRNPANNRARLRNRARTTKGETK